MEDNHEQPRAARNKAIDARKTIEALGAGEKEQPDLSFLQIVKLFKETPLAPHWIFIWRQRETSCWAQQTSHSARAKNPWEHRKQKKKQGQTG